MNLNLSLYLQFNYYIFARYIIINLLSFIHNLDESNRMSKSNS